MYDSLNDLYEVSVELVDNGFCKNPANEIIFIANKAQREMKRLSSNDLKHLFQQIVAIDNNPKFQKSHLAEDTIKSSIITYKYVIHNYRKHICRILLAQVFTMPSSNQFNPQSALMALLQCITQSKNITIEQQSLDWLSKNANTYNQLITNNNENWLKEAKAQITYFKDKLGKYRLHKKFSLKNISWGELLQEIERSINTAQHNIIANKQNRNKKGHASSSTSLILAERCPINPVDNHARQNQYKQPPSQAYQRIAAKISYFDSFVPGHPEYEAGRALNMGANISMNIKDREDLGHPYKLNDQPLHYERRFYRLPMSKDDEMEAEDYLSLSEKELKAVKKLFKHAVEERISANFSNQDSRSNRINRSRTKNTIHRDNKKKIKPPQPENNLALVTKKIKTIIVALEKKWFWGREERLKLEGILTGLKRKGKSYHDIFSVLQDDASYIRDSSNIFSRLMGKKKFETETLSNVINDLNKKMNDHDRRELLYGLIFPPKKQSSGRIELYKTNSYSLTFSPT